MARLKYPGGRRKSSSTEDRNSALSTQTRRKKKEKDEALPRKNCKVITRKEYRQIFGDSDDEDQEDFIGFSSEELGLRAYKRLASPRFYSDSLKSVNLFPSSTSIGSGSTLGSCSSTSSIASVNQDVNCVKKEPSLSGDSCYGKVQISDNIYAKTYKKRQSYERRRDKVFHNPDSLSSTTAFKSQATRQREIRKRNFGANTTHSRKPITLKSTKPLSIAKQLVEKAKEKRLQLQRKENKASSNGSVSRFGRTVKKKVLDYDDFTSSSNKRPLPDGDKPPNKMIKCEEGKRKSTTAGDNEFSENLRTVRIKLPYSESNQRFEEARFPRKVRLKNDSSALENAKNKIGTLSVKARLLDQGTIKTLLQEKLNTKCNLEDSLGKKTKVIFKSKRLRQKNIDGMEKERSSQVMQIKGKKLLARKQGIYKKLEDGKIMPSDGEDDFDVDIAKPSNRVVTKIIRKKMKNGKIKKIIKIVKLETASNDEETPVVPGRRRVRCGECDGCSIKKDCGKCTFCRDKPKFGGSGVMKQCCVRRKCKTPLPPDSRHVKVANKSLAKKRVEKLKKKYKAKETRSSARDVETRQRKPLPGPLLNHLKKAKDSNEIKFSWTDSYTEDNCWETGFHICVTNINSLPPMELCFLCGSAGKEKMLYCRVCAEPFHQFCLEEDPVDTQWWTCNRCRTCCVCGHQNKLLMCDKCQRCYHVECLGSNYPTDPQGDEEEVWLCARCVKCSKCGRTTAGDSAEDDWTHGFTMCAQCGKNWDLGNYCPLCNKCYCDDDFDSKMMQCIQCDHWIHASCQGLTDDEYQCLAVMPDDVQYFCKACSDEELPEWLDSVRQEIQAGFIYIFDALKSSTHYKVIQKDFEQAVFGNGHPRNLDAVQDKIKNQLYNCVASYTQDLLAIFHYAKEILIDEDACKSMSNLMSLFEKEMESIFPWQNLSWPVKEGVQDKEIEIKEVTPTTTERKLGDLSTVEADHSYTTREKKLDVDVEVKLCKELAKKDSNELLTNDTTKPAEEKMDLDKTTNNGDLTRLSLDKRKCVYCNEIGDDDAQGAGRLLYFNIDEWAHVNCVLWSAEVYEDDEGRLQHSLVALTRGRQMRCGYCGEVGATVGCCEPRCPENYHFMCGRKAEAAFLPDKSVYCNQHSFRAKNEVVLGEHEFSVERRVCVDMSKVKTTKKGLRGVVPDLLSVLSGCMSIKNLGKITTASDTSTILIPMHYKLTRLYWSTINPNKRCFYTCRTKAVDRLQKPSGTVPIESDNVMAKKIKDEHTVTCHENITNICGTSSDSLDPKTNCRLTNTPCGTTDLTKKSLLSSTSSKSLLDHSILAVSQPNKSNSCPGNDSREFKTLLQRPVIPLPKTAKTEYQRLAPRTPVKTHSHNVSAMDVLVDLTKEKTYRPSPVSRVTVTPNTKPSCDSVIRQSKIYKEIFPKPCLIRNPVLAPLAPRAIPIQFPRTKPVPLAPKPYPLAPSRPVHPTPTPRPTQQTKSVYLASSNVCSQSLPSQQLSSVSTVVQMNCQQNSKSPVDAGNLAVVVGSPEQITKLLTENPKMVQLLGDKSSAYLGQLLSSRSPLKQPDSQVVKESKDAKTLAMQNKCVNPNFCNMNSGKPRLLPAVKPTVSKIEGTSDSKGAPAIVVDLTKDGSDESAKAMKLTDNMQRSSLTLPSKTNNAEVAKVRTIVRKLDRGCLNNTFAPPKLGKDHVPSGKMIDFIDLSDSFARKQQLALQATTPSPSIASPCIRAQLTAKVSPQYIFNNRRFMHASLDIPVLEKKANKVSPLCSPAKIIQNVESQSQRLKPLMESSLKGNYNVSKMSEERAEEDKDPISKKEISKPCSKTNDSSVKVSKRKTLDKLKIKKTTAKKDRVKRKIDSEEIKPTKKRKIGEDDVALPDFKCTRQPDSKNKRLEKVNEESSVIFTITNEEGFKIEARTCEEAWRAVFDKVQSVRMDHSESYTSFVGADGMDMLGLTREPLIYLIEQLPGTKNCSRYSFQYHHHGSFRNDEDEDDEEVKENEHGCARAEIFTNRKKRTDMFSFLASSHRKLSQVPIDNTDDPDIAQEIASRRGTANDLPMAMRYRFLKQSNTKRTVGVFKSPIHRRGLFCLRDIDTGEMLIEYTGMVIRSVLTDKREKYYESKGIGCYMFRVDSYDVVDATTCGDAARFINHSCEPNCYSRVINVEGKKKIIIFAARPLKRGEELTYDYKFPLEDEKIPCTCTSKKCRKYLN